jgi:ATP-dependent helicase/nuclease subunit B
MNAQTPHVYYIPAHRPAAQEIARAILHHYGDDFTALSDIDIFVPNRRSCRTLAEAFLAVRDGKPCLLPRIQPIGDVNEDDLMLTDIFSDPLSDIPPAIPALERQILLGRLIHTYRPTVPPAHIFRLAGHLAALIDHVHTERLDWRNLEHIVPADLAEHWQVTVEFLSLLFENWPLILQERGLIDPADRRNRLLERKADFLRQKTSDRPIIAVGSTGSIPATRDLLRTIAYLPHGQLILTGLEQRTPETAWDNLSETHPQFYFKHLLDHIGMARGHVAPWPLLVEPQQIAPPRTLILEQCVQGTATLPEQSFDPHGLTGIERVRAENHQEEAKIIALKIRETLEQPQKNILLVTPDRSLARRVESELGRWDIRVNDSAGRPLTDTLIGTWLHVTSALMDRSSTASALLSLLHHPFCSLSYDTAEYRPTLALFEKYIIRGPSWKNGVSNISAITQERLPEKHPEHHDALLEFARRIENATSDIYNHTEHALPDWLSYHIHVAEIFATTPTQMGADRIWDSEEGTLAAEKLRDLMACAPLDPTIMDATAYHDFIATYLGQHTYRPRFPLHPRVNILGPIEARMQNADVMILAGLNETIWPRETPHDPFMSQPMRDAFGLSPFRRRIGQAALDFYMLCHAPHIMLTYSHTQNGAAMAPSRWLQQMDIVLHQHQALHLIDTPFWPYLVRTMDKPDTITPQPRPAFAPPRATRPRTLSVSDLALWRQDPYGLYAKKILGLRKLDDADTDIAARDWGNLVHSLIEHTIIHKPFPLAQWHNMAREKLAQMALPDMLALQWQSRLNQIGQYLADHPVSFDKIDTEITGTYHYADLDFTVHGRADMLLHHGDAITIADSKTGTIPSWPQVENGFAPQLPFLALALSQKGFKHIPPQAKLEALSYWDIKGKNKDAVRIVTYKKDIQEMLERNRSIFARMVSLFDQEQTPYVTRPHPKYINSYNDYAHLERIQEWSSQSDGDAA